MVECGVERRWHFLWTFFSIDEEGVVLVRLGDVSEGRKGGWRLRCGGDFVAVWKFRVSRMARFGTVVVDT